MARAYKALPPASELWELFDYKPLTGELVRKSMPHYKGTTNTYGHIVRAVHKQLFMDHRLVWSWVTGSDPVKLIDHKDGNPANNRFWNLRLCTHAENMRNRKNTKGYSDRRKNKWSPPNWRMQIKVDGKMIRKSFSTEAEARAAYEKASLELHGEFSGVAP